MNQFKRYIAGDFRAHEIRRYVYTEAIIFWGLISLAWLSYPAEHHYSIMSHTFSFLGTWDPQHNPQYWYIFSAAMSFWSMASVPLVFYHHRRFALISRWGAHLGAFLLLIGCVGVLGVACFPDARGEVIGKLEWTHIHEKAAIMVAAGYTLGLLWYGGMLLWDRIACTLHGQRGPFNHWRMAWPYLFWLAVTGIAVTNQIMWGIQYEKMKKAAAAAGTHIGSSWAMSLNTINAFPLWENIVIYALFIFLAWFSLAVPNEIPQRVEDRK